MYVLQRDASRFPSRETAPTELLPGSHTPHLRSSCLSVLHCEHCEAPVCFTCAYSFHVPTSRMCPRVPAALLYAVGLMEGFLGKAGLGPEVRSDLSVLHTPQSSHHAISSQSVNYPAFRPCVHCPPVSQACLYAV